VSGRNVDPGSPPVPPDRCSAVRAASALVLAPHHDDEVLGCGGLLAQLAAGGAAVRVLFLTDGGGGEEAVGDRDAYRARRRAEAAAVAERMGFAGTDHLAIPDGELALRLEEAAAAIRRALIAFRPELLLVPAPTEASADHRAAFAALHRLLAPLRPGGGSPAETDGAALFEAVRGLTVLAYEVNRPGWPDLLVDVGAELPLLAEAMALYASQQERRDYWRAALGLRRYRTLTLPPEVEAAEGYRRLVLDDFVTASPAQLVRRLGALPEVAEVREGPRISVLVRTKDRPALLAEALASLAAGAYRRAEVVLVNDGGAPPSPPADYPLPLVRVDLPENRGRAAAAGAGVERASGDFVAFLDDDDLAAPEHLATLAGLVAGSGVRVAYTDAAVGIYELDPGSPGEAGGWRCAERRLPYSRDFDPDLLLLDNYIPFNTLLIERGLFAEVGPFDPELPFFEDWDFLIRLAARVAFHHLPRVTCEYRHFRGAGHHVLGESPRGRADFLAMKARVLAKHAALATPERLARAVDTLRRERVEAAEEAAALGREADRLRAEGADLEERYHRVHGEADALSRERERLTAEAERLYRDERDLRAVVGDQTAHLGRTYAEIERLGGVIREMEATRAWRAHLWLERRRGRGPGGGEPGAG